MHWISQKIKQRLWPAFIGLMVALLIVACQGENSRLSSQAGSSDSCRAIQHAAGETCVPDVPTRLVSLDSTTLADAIALGTTPVGASLTGGQLPNSLADYSEQIEQLGTSEQPNLEKILQNQPDLILGIELFGESIFTQLSQIAPTVLGRWNGFPLWREHFDFVADVLGKQEQAEQVWIDYTQKASALKASLADKLKEKEVSIAYACCGTVTIDAENSFAGSILADVGIRRPASQGAADRGIIILSEERIPELDADILFISVYDDEDSADVMNTWEKKPLWKQLKAVQNDQVYFVDYSVWRAGDPLSANFVLDDLEQYLAG